MVSGNYSLNPELYFRPRWWRWICSTLCSKDETSGERRKSDRIGHRVFAGFDFRISLLSLVSDACSGIHSCLDQARMNEDAQTRRSWTTRYTS